MDEEQTYRKPCQNRGDDLLIEDKDFAVVYNGSVGGTYEVFLKHTEQEVRDHITRYGIGRASEDVKAVAREMTAEEFSELAQRKMPIFQMPNGGLLNLQYNKDKDSLDVGTVTNAGLSVKHTFLSATTILWTQTSALRMSNCLTWRSTRRKRYKRSTLPSPLSEDESSIVVYTNRRLYYS